MLRLRVGKCNHLRAAAEEFLLISGERGKGVLTVRTFLVVLGIVLLSSTFGYAQGDEGNVDPAKFPVVTYPDLPQCDPNDPDLLLPDLRPEDPSQIRNVYQGGRRVLSFTTAVDNIGDGPLLLKGLTVSTDAGLQTAAFQIISRTDGSQCAREAGVFVFHPTHNHWHFGDFVGYELRDANPTSSKVVASDLVAGGQKASFCLLDVRPVHGYNPSKYPIAAGIGNCKSQESYQGIDVGWADVYERRYPDQVINLDPDPQHQVPEGSYYLVNVVDPLNLIWETDKTNNTAATATSVILPPPDLAALASEPTPRTRPPHIIQPRPRPVPRGTPAIPVVGVTPAPTAGPAGRVRPTRPPRPARPTRAPRATRPPRPTRPPRATRAPKVHPTPRPRATRAPKVVPPKHPTRLPRPGEVVPTPTAQIVSGASCANACPYALSQVHMTWYDNTGLWFTAMINPGQCAPLTPTDGKTVQFQMTNWVTQDQRDTGLSYSDSVTIGDKKGASSVSFSPVASGYRLTYKATPPAIAHASDSNNFPVAFDLCIKVGDQAIAMRPVCQPKSTGMLCHL